MNRVLIALILVLVPAFAWAQDPGAAPKAPAYRDYSASGFGFHISLPASGTIDSPSTEGWKEDAGTAFIWWGSGAEPIGKVVARSDSFGTAVDADAFKLFCDALLEQWGQNENQHKLLTKNKLVKSGNLTWNLIEAEDPSQDGKSKVYYSVFITYSGDSIYTLSMYYDHAPDSAIQAFGAPIIAGFKPLGE
jgi:hypothetical protein